MSSLEFNSLMRTLKPKPKKLSDSLGKKDSRLNSTGPVKALAVKSPGKSKFKVENPNRLSKTRKTEPGFQFKNVTPRRKQPVSPSGRKIKSANHRRRASVTGPVIRKPSEKKTHTRRFSVDTSLTSIIAKFTHKSRQGYIPDNPQKQNQDSFFECINFRSSSDTYLFGVCDGHGYFGRQVSTFVKQRLPILISEDPLFNTDIKKCLTNSIQRCNRELVELNFDTNFSGTTLVMVVIKGKTLWCANVGDSRALVARQIQDPSQHSSGRHWMSVALSRDHKPDLKEELSRIFHAGGRVESYADQMGNPVGPARVWLRHQDIPGLAMSRSLGDGVAASVGVICTPEILEFNLTSDDKFLVLGSDGVFEFLSNEEVVKMVIPYWKLGDIEGAVDRLERESVARWKMEEEVIDDITSLCVFLDIN